MTLLAQNQKPHILARARSRRALNVAAIPAVPRGPSATRAIDTAASAFLVATLRAALAAGVVIIDADGIMRRTR
jgi:hypothetical protein